MLKFSGNLQVEEDSKDYKEIEDYLVNVEIRVKRVETDHKVI